MTVQTTVKRYDAYGNGVTTVFPIPFYFLDNTHLTVLSTAPGADAVTLSLGSDYSVSGAGDTAGGYLTLTTALASGVKLSILRNVPLTQLTHYVPNDPFPAASHERALDQLTMEVQQVQEQVDRSLTLPPSSSGVSTELPVPASNNIIAWNETATGLQNLDPADLSAIVAFGTAEGDVFTGDGVTTDFTLASSPGALNNLAVSVGGVVQLPLIDYTWTGGTALSFVTAPPSGVKILARYMQGLPASSGVSYADLANVADDTKGDYLVGVRASLPGAVSRTQHDVNADTVNVLDFMTDAQRADVRGFTFALDVSDAFAAAIAAVPASGGTVRVPSGGYSVIILVERSNLTIRGDGSASTILKAPAGDNRNVIDVGGCTTSTPAYNNVNIFGLTIDGNYTNTPEPTDDLHGHGIIQTNVSCSFIDDVVCQNCWTTGLDTVIQSNQNHITVTVKNCGNSSLGYPNFDVNSCNNSVYNVVSYGGHIGARLLQNSQGCVLNATVVAPVQHGVVYDCQLIGFHNYANQINALVFGGCTGYGLVIGPNSKSSIINAVISEVTGGGVRELGAESSIPLANCSTGNIYNISTFNCQQQSCYIESNHNFWHINSVLDGRGGTAGTYSAIVVSGTGNCISARVQDSSTWQVRGIYLAATSANNHIVDYVYTNTIDPYNDYGTGNSLARGESVGSSLASASTLGVPLQGSFFNVTGTTTITDLGGQAFSRGRQIVLKFAGAVTLTHSATLVLNGATNFTTAAGNVLSFVCDGTSWYETSRKV